MEGFHFLFGTSGYPPQGRQKLWGFCRLSNEISGGLQYARRPAQGPPKRPTTSATLWTPYGEKPLVPKRKGKSLFALSSVHQGLIQAYAASAVST